MPTECERSLTSPSVTTTATASGSVPATTAGGVASAALIAAEIQSSNSYEDLSHQQEQQQMSSSMMEGDMSTSQTSTTSNGSSCNGGQRKTSITSPDPTAYVAKARVTRPTPPPPPYNPMQFVQIKPCNLYQTAQEQLKKAEEVKKIKEIRKEEPEDWQNNLDNWKSSRRKRVEHIIDRVVEVKKLELEEHDRTRRKSKTFSELIENRGERVGRPGLNKLASLAVYNEDESNDLSDLGIGTSSASGKSSLSEDYDNNSVMSDNAAELDKAISNSNHKPLTESTTREYISSPGYETSSSTAPASSPDPCEYTYEGAIQDYKQRVSRAAASGLTSQALNKQQQLQQQQHNSKESTPERAVKEASYPPRRGSKIEDRLIGFEVQSPSEECVGEKNKVDVPKIDISKRKEIFESQSSETKVTSTSGVPRVTLRDRFKPQEISEPVEVTAKKDVKRLSGDITSIKERLQNLEQQQNLVNGANGASKITANKLVDISVPPLKERLSSLQSAVTKEEVRKPPVALVDARQLEIMKSEEEKVKQTLKEEVPTKHNHNTKNEVKTTTTTITTNSAVNTNLNSSQNQITSEESEVDRDDSGIHTADDIDIVEDRVNTEHIKKEQELKLNAAIEALAMEEKQFAEAASAVNQIEAEFEELTLGSVTLPPLASSVTSNGTSSNASAAVTSSTNSSSNANNTNTTTTITNDHMEYSVSSTNQIITSLSSSSPKSPISSDSNSNASSLLSNVEVKGKAAAAAAAEAGADASQVPAAGSSLRRKPTNEMVHAKNLLKIFKETFQNDIELDEGDDDHRNEQETKQIPRDHTQMPKEKTVIKTQIFEKSIAKSGNVEVGTVKDSKASSEVSKSTSVTPCNPVSTTMIPRCVTPSVKTPLSPITIRSNMKFQDDLPPGSPKTPLSPLTIRSTTKFRDETPPGSPFSNRKHDSQFSINGRVEIFNSKNMATSPVNPPRASTPTMTTKKTLLPHITTTNATPPSSPSPSTASVALPKSSAPHDIRLPEQTKQSKQQHPAAAVTALQSQKAAATATVTTVIEPLPSQETKSMPLRQMVNEPHTATATATATNVVATLGDIRETSNHNQSADDAVKHHQPEVVVCAPPITIVNPDELPKPNTVKNLSSCFQQQRHDAAAPIPSSSVGLGGKLISPKPLPRSRIPQATPPQSPLATKRNAAANHGEKIAVVWPPPSSSHHSATTSPLDEEKKLSLVSTSSTSSSSTGCTVIEVNKKLSLMSNASSISTDSSIVAPTEVITRAQVHKGEVEKFPKVDAGKKAIHEPTKTVESEVTAAKPIKADLVEDKATTVELSVTETNFNPDEIKPSEAKLEIKTCDLPKSQIVQAGASEPSKDEFTKAQQITDPQFKELLNNFIKIEAQFSQPCEIQSKPKPVTSPISEKAITAIKTKEENKPKSPQVVQRKSSLKKVNDNEKPLKTVAFSEEIANETNQSTELKAPEATTSKADESKADVDIKALQNDFLQTETDFSQTCETKPSSVPYQAPLQPIKPVLPDNDDVKDDVQLPSQTNEMSDKSLNSSQLSKEESSVPPLPSKKPPLFIDVGPIATESDMTLPATPLSPSSQLFRTTKPLVVSTLYDKYGKDSPKSPSNDTSLLKLTETDLKPPNNQRPIAPPRKKDDRPVSPSVVVPSELPHLVDCPPNDSTLYKLASSAPHSPVSPSSPSTLEMDSALCTSLLTSMAATPDMVDFQRQQTVEEAPCLKVDVNNMPIEKVVSSTDYIEVSKDDVKQSEGFVSKLMHRIQSPKMKRQIPVEEEPCQKMDIRDMPDGKYTPITDYKSISPSEIQKCDKFFSNPLGRPQSPIMEARAAHSKALIETCEKIIAEEKVAKNQMKSSMPTVEPQVTPVLPRKSKIPKPLPSCCKAVESLTEADLQVRPTTPKTPSEPTTAKDDAVIARMHVVETQIKVTTTTPPTSPKEAGSKAAPPMSPQPAKKTKNIFDFIKKNFGVGGGSSSSQKEGEDQVDSKLKVTIPPPPSVVQSDNKVLVLTPEDVKNFDQVHYDEIHNVDNSKFYLPSDDVAPPPLPKTPAPVNIEITRKIITDEIVEDGKTEVELTDEIDALLDVELNKLNNEIDELEKAGKK